MAYFPFDPMAARIPILKRLVPSALKRWTRLAWTGGFKVVRAHRILFLARGTDFVDRHIAFYGDYEPKERRFIESQLAAFQPTVFLDVGANLGYFAALAAKRWNIPRIIALEPEPSNYCHLCATLFLNGLVGRVETYNVAASDHATTLDFHSSADTFSGRSHVAPKATANMRVRAEAIDSLFQLRDERLLVKMDVEGHEDKALAGMERTLTDNDALLMVESLADQRDSVDAWLAQRGFERIHVIGDNRFYRSAS
jgi:FkbM family methyltransferase